ncbi:MAG: DUF4838 domain-containing protein, partial [Bacteroidales bacterium]|nr:DUF4838 domain-containing protein [Bacteroidales bacterium]
LACVTCCKDDLVTINPEKAVIVSSAGSITSAVEELKTHLKLITGIDVPETKNVSTQAFVFSFDTNIIDNNQEACAWEVTDKGVVFRGNPYFAVLDFLENSLGVRWPEADVVAYDEQKVLVIKNKKGAWIPGLKIRTIRSSRDSVSGLFTKRMRGGRHDAPIYGHAFTKYWTRFGATRRDYFAMRKDGLRGPKKYTDKELMGNIAVLAANKEVIHVAMCCTSTGLVEQIVSDWIAAGKGEYINLCENDVPGQDSCQCPECKALDVVPEKVDPQWETHYSDRYVYFGNRVLEAARKYRADVKVCYYAYNATQDAPAKMRPDSASVIGAVPTIFTDKHVDEYIKSWKNVGAKKFFYRPNRHHYYQCPYLPIGSEEHFYGIFKCLYDAGTIGFDYDAKACNLGGFEWFERYVLFHAMQDPSKPFSYWEDHYFAAYGAAAEDAKAYYRFWREEVWNKRLEPNLDDITKKGKWFNFGRGLVQNLNDYFKTDDFEAAEKYLKAAESKNLSASRRELVRRLRIAHDHSKMFFEAVAHKSKDNTEKLIAFRRLHGFPIYNWSEQYYGDITGVEALLGPNPNKKKKAK